MRTKHTNGQWTAEKINKNYMILSDRMYIGSISSSDVESEQAEANAQLIASAPELLEALLAVQKDLEQFSLLPSTENLINNAILKAIK